VSRKKNVLNTSFRSATQATDSTCSGWSANSAATIPLRHRAPVIFLSRMYSRRAFAIWKSRFVR
jgi:hypothetical protein